jgi:uncharacterized protein (TIGR02996 family)
MDPEERAFITALNAQPEDRTTLLVYADWLEEHDREPDATALRGPLYGPTIECTTPYDASPNRTVRTRIAHCVVGAAPWARPVFRLDGSEGLLYLLSFSLMPQNHNGENWLFSVENRGMVYLSYFVNPVTSQFPKPVILVPKVEFRLGPTDAPMGRTSVAIKIELQG